jgi:hypothetical protein
MLVEFSPLLTFNLNIIEKLLFIILVVLWSCFQGGGFWPIFINCISNCFQSNLNFRKFNTIKFIWSKLIFKSQITLCIGGGGGGGPLMIYVCICYLCCVKKWTWHYVSLHELHISKSNQIETERYNATPCFELW